MSSPDQPPISHFWVAIYDDDTAISQFDIHTGKEVLYKHVDVTRVKNIGWYPITNKMLPLFVQANPTHNLILGLGLLRINVSPGKEYVILRRNKLKYSFSHKVENPRETFYMLGVKGNLYAFMNSLGNVEMTEDYNHVLGR